MIRTTEAPVYAAELVASVAYATFLQACDRKYEPDWTWLTVVGGVLISSAPAILLARYDPPTWRDYERRVIAGFLTSGVIIVGWQLWDQAKRRGRTEGYVLARRTHAPQEREDAHPTPPMDRPH